MPRAIIDNALIGSGTLPIAANTVNGAAIDLGATTPYPITEVVQVKLSGTTATGANNKNINIRLQDSADNVTWANIATVINPALRLAGNTEAVVAGSVTLALPLATRRYIRAVALGEADGADSSDGTFKAELVL